jgi:hypothetical protein
MILVNYKCIPNFLSKTSRDETTWEAGEYTGRQDVGLKEPGCEALDLFHSG